MSGHTTPAARRRWQSKMLTEGRCFKCGASESLERGRCYRCRFKYLNYQRHYIATRRAG